MIFRCDLSAQHRAYEKEIMRAVQKVLESGRYTLAEEVHAFESELAAYLGCRHAVSVANATDGLILTMKALGIQDGDEVITTPFTAIPTVSAIVAAGAKPVFVDIDDETFLLDIDQVSTAITTKTKAVIPVHIFGNVVDIHRLRQNIPDHIPIIEDAAQASGSRIDGEQAGAMGTAGVFSFYPTKNLGACGDGGAIATNDDALAQKLKLLRMYGMTDKDHIAIHGVNSRLDELQAAILRVKLRHLDKMNQKRNEIAERYKRHIALPFFRYQEVKDNTDCNFHVFPAIADHSRASLMAHLDRENIQTNIYYPIPLHLQKANEYLGYERGDFPRTEQLCDHIMALPMYPELPMDLLNTIITAINRFPDK